MYRISAACLLLLLYFALFSWRHVSISSIVRTNSTGVFYRVGGLTNEGYGSYFQRLKSSIILAQLLSKELLVDPEVESEHRYNVARLLNNATIDPTIMNSGAVGNFCTIAADDALTQPDFLRQACIWLASGNGILPNYARLQQLRSCPMIIQWQRVELYEQFNDCIRSWLQRKFGLIFATARSKEGRYSLIPVTNCLNVAIHLRWGDVRTGNLSQLDVRSIAIDQVRRAIELLPAELCYHYWLFMKNHPLEVIRLLPVNLTVIDAADDLRDLFLYQQMDLYLQGVSSFAVLGSLLAPSQKLIITSTPYSSKYTYISNGQGNLIYQHNDDAITGAVRAYAATLKYR